MLSCIDADCFVLLTTCGNYCELHRALNKPTLMAIPRLIQMECSLSHPFMQLDQSSLLRLEAEVQLENGTTSLGSNWPISMSTMLSLLSQTASEEGAEVSLKVLHELQVFQVELDLMQHQMASNEEVLSEDLQLYRGLFEHLPQPCFILNRSGLVHSSNQAAVSLLGHQWGGSTGQAGLSLLSHLVKESQLQLHAIFLRLQAGSQRERLLLQLNNQQQPLPWVVTQLPGQHFILMQHDPKN
jgi:PAS domain-containing protein